ncbi:demethylmenaquinone methyltransferase-like [Oscarella lobularis]|uniref:demethylmenaquinone methyltransferase-like n=1 Tax=Oscarella lobularis TaxID=121494 RepID=UPI003314403F
MAAYDKASDYLQASKDSTKFLDTLKPQCGDRSLDFGCGTGKVTLKLAERIGPTGFLVAVDPSEERICEARKRFQNRGNVQIIRGYIDDAEEFAPYDIILANFVLHWIPEKEQGNTLQTIFKFLKPGGRLGLTTVNKESSGFLHDLSERQYGNSYDAFLSAAGWTFRSLQNWKPLLERAGFDIVHSVEELRRYPFPNYRALIKWWEATSDGPFSATKAEEDLVKNESILDNYGWSKNGPVSSNCVHIDIVARKA